MKYYISKEAGSVYSLKGDSLFYVPLNNDGTFDTEDGGMVDHDLASEPIGKGRTFYDVWELARKRLAVHSEEYMKGVADTLKRVDELGLVDSADLAKEFDN